MDRAAALLILAGCSSLPPAFPSPAAPVPGVHLARSLADLQSDDPGRREEAVRLLENLYPDTRILPALHDASERDPETEARLRSLLLRLHEIRDLERRRTPVLRIDSPPAPRSARELLEHVCKLAGWTLQGPPDLGRRLDIGFSSRSPWHAIDDVCRAHGGWNCEIFGKSVAISETPYRPALFLIGPGVALQWAPADPWDDVLQWSVSWCGGLSPDWCELGVVEGEFNDGPAIDLIGQSKRTAPGAEGLAMRLNVLRFRQAKLRHRLRCGFVFAEQPIAEVEDSPAGMKCTSRWGHEMQVSSLRPGETLRVRLRIRDPRRELDDIPLHAAVTANDGSMRLGEIISAQRQDEFLHISIWIPEMQGRNLRRLEMSAAVTRILEIEAHLSLFLDGRPALLSSGR